jgi:hypothetical protein
MSLPVSSTSPEDRFRQSAARLTKVLSKSIKTGLDTISFPDFSSPTVDVKIESLTSALDNVLNALVRKTIDEERKMIWQKAKCIAFRILRGVYPFANLALSVAKEGASVRIDTLASLTTRFRF